ncbi:hypothetical protein CRE_06369 [Caenorhabditis remanei]|uniref:F-box domain-containing protein n=1 Tax=Caenorhabditis remanei TaxID=31234 RepID=E3M1S7_CAERE|nr:hypothetical protein CRE_06369 [Caenorhabditis remanei]
MLLKLPYLAQFTILKHLELHDHFFLGLCSKRARNLIKCFSRNKNDSSVINLYSFSIQLQKTGFLGKDVVMWASCYYRPENETLYRSNTNWNRSIIFWYKDKKIKCKISFHSTKGIPILWCKDKYKRMLPMAIYHSICEIFSISPIIQIKFDMSRLSEFPDTNEIDNVITGCRDKDQIEEFLKNVIIRNATQLWLGSCQLSVDSVILSLEHALFWSPK